MRLALGACLLGALPAQANPDRVLVLVRQPASPTAALHEIDLTTGTQIPLAGFPSDNLPPLAIAVDPATREPVLALATGGNSRLVRVHLQGLQVLGETVLAALPGTAVGMMFPTVGDLFVATEGPIGGPIGGVYRIPRQGGAPTLLWSSAGISALSEPVILPGKYWTAQDQSPSTPTLNAFLDASPGAPAAGPYPVSWLPNTRLTGVHEFLRSGRVQMFSDTLGRVHEVRLPNQATWTLVQMQPAIPAGGARRLKGGPDGQVLVLGGSVDPTLKSFPESTVQVVVPINVVGGPFAGDPIDFAVVASAEARSIRFGTPCQNPVGSTIAAVGEPQLGNIAFAVRQENGLPNTLALFVAGLSERQFAGTPLPLALGTCELLVSVDLVLAQVTDNAGAATQPLAIPPTPSLSGQIAYAQWWQDLLSLRGSDALALHLF